MLKELMKYFDEHEGEYFTRAQLIKKFDVNTSRLGRGLRRIMHYDDYEAKIIRDAKKGYYVCHYGKKRYRG